MEPNAVKSAALCRIYHGKDEIEALRSVNMAVSKGELFNLLGPNGAGKTAFLRIISAQLLASDGDAHVNGHSVMSEAEDIGRKEGNIFD